MREKNKQLLGLAAAVTVFRKQFKCKLNMIYFKYDLQYR